MFIIKVFIGILGDSFEIQFLAIFYIIRCLKRDLIKFEIEFLYFYYCFFHWNIRGTPNTKYPLIIKIDHRVYYLVGRGGVLVIGREDYL